MHESTFEYLKPTDVQLEAMSEARFAFAECMRRVLTVVPDGPDRTYLIRKLRECAMWANIAIARLPDGSPRT